MDCRELKSAESAGANVFHSSLQVRVPKSATRTTFKGFNPGVV
jgi:hypothetical protein